MRTLVQIVVLSGMLLVRPAPAWPSEDGTTVAAAYPEPAYEVIEPGMEPTQPPAEPPPQALPPPPADAPAAAPQAAPPGQWVYTAQYGWVWMPYADAYTYVPPSGAGEPYEFVYYPAYGGWTWVVAPWVWGFGPWPHFGVIGPARFAWFGHGWWRTPGRFHFAPGFHRGGFGHHGIASPFRGGGVVPRGGFGGGGRFVGGGHVPRGFGGGHVSFARGHSGGVGVGHAGGHRGGGGRGGGGGRAGGHR